MVLRMDFNMKISEVQIVPVKPVDGLVAFASCVINGQIYLGSLGIHTRLDGTGYRITYPTRRVGAREVNYYHPITKHAGCAIEQAINAKCNEVFEKGDESYGRHHKATHTSKQSFDI